MLVAIAILHKSWDTKLNISDLSESMPLTTLCFNCLKIKIAKFGVYNYSDLLEHNNYFAWSPSFLDFW
jgi:hypothetical protein